MKKGYLLAGLIVFVLFLTPVIAQGFSDEELDDLVERQMSCFDIIQNCKAGSCTPPDTGDDVTKVEVRGLVEGKCKVIYYLGSRETAEYLLPKDIYSTFSDPRVLVDVSDCTGACAAVEEITTAHEPAGPEEACMEECIVRDCDEGTFRCMEKNKERCEDECGMIKGSSVEDMDDLERCIYDCVGPEVICGPSGGGEQNPACMVCAAECVSIHGSGNNCLTEEQWESEEKSCETCQHCYGEPVYGPSGDGYDCIIDVRCFDASGEWGDEPGTGPDSWEAGHEPRADQIYWWDYDTRLEVSDDGESTLTVTDNGRENEVRFNSGEEIETDVRGDSFILKTDGEEIATDETIDQLISQYASDVAEIEEINLTVEEGVVLYKITITEEANLLGFIPINFSVFMIIDADNLSLIDKEKPWWSFLAFGEEEVLLPVGENMSDEDYTCKDSDGGLDYWKGGYLYMEVQQEGVSMPLQTVSVDNPYHDTCIDGTTVEEFYCDDNQEESALYDCEEVCFENACETIDISDIEVEEVTPYPAITWKTNIPTTSKVIYKKASDIEPMEMSSSIETEDHSVEILTGLEPETTYNFQVVSCIEDVFCKQSEIVEFETAYADDVDGDGIENKDDDCPEEQETANGFMDEDGCPDFLSYNILITDTKNNIVLEIEQSTNEIVWFYGAGLHNPASAERLPNTNTLITDTQNHRVLEVDMDKNPVWECHEVSLDGISQELAYPADSTRLPNGNTLIADYDENRVIEINTDCEIVWAVQRFERPMAAERLANGNTVVADSGNKRVATVNGAGDIVYEKLFDFKPIDVSIVPVDIYPEDDETLFKLHKKGDYMVTMAEDALIEVDPVGDEWYWASGLATYKDEIWPYPDYPTSAMVLTDTHLLLSASDSHSAEIYYPYDTLIYGMYSEEKDSLVWYYDNLSGPFDATIAPRDLDNDGTPDDWDLDDDEDTIEDTGDNCPYDPNQNQDDDDDDGLGNVCDNCPADDNPEQENFDGDSLGDVCDDDDDNDLVSDADDNCHFIANTDQDDVDDDGEGDACDCDDGIIGPNEVGADCLGICEADCPKCVPYQISGDSGDKIDIVFLRDLSYDANLSEFNDAIDNMIANGYGGEGLIKDNLDKFNFWYHKGIANYYEGDNKSTNGKCTDKSHYEFPDTYDLDAPYGCAFADVAVFMYAGGGRGCTSGTKFAFTFNEVGTLVHETGHALFELKDEYCCDGGYAQKDTNPNNFKSKGECEDYADDQGLDPDHCFLFCPKTKYWPASADQIALCKLYYNNKGEPDNVKHCDCTATAVNYSFGAALCTAGADADDAVPYWKTFWASRAVTDMDDLTVTSPNWWYNRGGFNQSCNSNAEGWWLLDASLYNPDYQGDCRMKSGPLFNDTCTIGVMDVLDKYD